MFKHFVASTKCFHRLPYGGEFQEILEIQFYLEQSRRYYVTTVKTMAELRRNLEKRGLETKERKDVVNQPDKIELPPNRSNYEKEKPERSTINSENNLSGQLNDWFTSTINRRRPVINPGFEMKNDRNNNYYDDLHDEQENPAIYNIAPRRRIISRLEITLDQLNSKPKSLTIRKLIYLPNHFLELNEELNFVKYISLKWLSVLEEEIEKILPFNLPVTLLGLAKINKATNGDLVETLDAERLLKLFFIVLDSYLEISPNRFSVLLKSATVLFPSPKFNEIRNKLSKKLCDIIPQYFNACVEKKLKFSDRISLEICYILYEMIQLGVEKPESLCFKDIITLFTQFFDTEPRKFQDDGDYFCNLNWMAFVFLKWYVDSNDLPKNFWSKWFGSVANYRPVLLKEQRFLWVMALENFLLIALRYDQYEELLKYKLFLIKNLETLIIPTDILMLIQKGIEKKLACKLGSSVENVLNEILNALK